MICDHENCSDKATHTVKTVSVVGTVWNTEVCDSHVRLLFTRYIAMENFTAITIQKGVFA